jgi:hypothetical protein
MKRVIRALALTSVLVVVAGFFLSLVAERAVAQVRAALVKNIDEPGRMPYQRIETFLPTAPECLNPTICTLSFAAVPAGKRLVVEQMSMLLFVSTGGKPTFLAFGDGFNPNVSNVEILEPDFTLSPVGASGADSWSINRSVRVYYGAGEIPRLKVRASDDFAPFFSNATLHGYLIDAAN